MPVTRIITMANNNYGLHLNIDFHVHDVGEKNSKSEIIIFQNGKTNGSYNPDGNSEPSH